MQFFIIKVTTQEAKANYRNNMET